MKIFVCLFLLFQRPNCFSFCECSDDQFLSSAFGSITWVSLYESFELHYSTPVWYKCIAIFDYSLGCFGHLKQGIPWSFWKEQNICLLCFGCNKSVTQSATSAPQLDLVPYRWDGSINVLSTLLSVLIISGGGIPSLFLPLQDRAQTSKYG